MAMIACKECAHKISDRAVSCPNCGAPLAGDPRRRRWQALFGALIALAVLAVIVPVAWPLIAAGPLRSLGAIYSFNSPSTSVPTTKTFSEDDSKSPRMIYQTTADQLYQDYNNNGVAIQTRIGEGGVRVSGAIAAIEEDTAGHAVVKLATNRPGSSADMTLTGDQTAAAAQLTKGQAVDIQCSSMRGVNGLPVGSQCSLAVVNAASAAPAIAASSVEPLKPAVAPTTATRATDLAAHSKSGRPRPQSPSAPRVTTARTSSPTESAMAPTADASATEAVPEPVPVAPVPATPAAPRGAPGTNAAAASVVAAAPPPDANVPQTAAAASTEVPAAAAAVATDDLATVRKTDPAAADHIASYCSKSIGAVNGNSYAVGCRRDEQAAWTRLVQNHEFSALDDDTRRMCSEPPFPDSYTAKESCARYQLSKTSASVQR